MVKFGYFKCNNCGKEVKKTKEKQHKCFKREQEERCPICSAKVALTNYDVHYKVCQGREFWSTYKSCFKFILRGTKRWNQTMKNRAFIGTRSECKYFLKKEDIPGSINQNRYWLTSQGRKREENALLQIRGEAYKMGLKFDDLHLSEAYKDVECQTFPGISARQVIFTFLRDRNIGNRELIDRIDNKLYKVDYPTDEEIQAIDILYDQIKELRNVYRYNEIFQEFYYLLVRCYDNPEEHRCPYCTGFYCDVKRHYSVCFSFKQAFYRDRTKVISDYLKSYTNYAKWSQAKIAYYIDYYNESSHDYFLDTINEHIRNRAKFLKKVEYEEEQARKERGEVKLGRKFVEDLINEVRKWCGMIKRDFSMNVYDFRELEAKIERGEAIKEEEEVGPSKDNKKKDFDNVSLGSFKDEFDKAEEVEVEDENSLSLDKPRRIPEKQVRAMKLLLAKKEKPPEKKPVFEDPKPEPLPPDAFIQMSNELVEHNKNIEFYKQMGFDDFNFLD